MEFGPILRAMLTNKPRFGLIVMQIAVTLAIIANCIVLLLAAREKMSVSLGFDEERFVSGQLICPLPTKHSPEERAAWFQQTIDDVRRIPGVESVSRSHFMPLQCMWRDVVKPANTNAPPIAAGECTIDEVLPDTLGLTVDEGRWFSREEAQQDADVVVIHRVLGQHLFGNEPLLGQSIQDFRGHVLRIVGVVQDTRITGSTHFAGWDGNDTQCVIYKPGVTQRSFIARLADSKAEEARASMEQYLASQNAILSLQTFAEIRNRLFGQQRTIVAVLGSLACLLVLIASISISGLASFSVTQRIRQIGVRRALGATTTDILRYFLTETGIITVVGLALGSGLSVPLNMVILRFYDSAKLNVPVVGGCALLLFLVALGAALPPALRASRVSPAIATRNV
jgi:putative ABC transport system permease protein